MRLPSALRLDDQLCFALYAATNSITRAYRPLLEQLGLTYPQYLVMIVLWQDGELAVYEIAERLNLPSHALSPLLARLEYAGLLTRHRDAPDRRVVRVRLTAAGSQLEPSAAAAQRSVVCATGLAREALAALRGDLHNLVDDLRATAAGLHPMEGKAS